MSILTNPFTLHSLSTHPPLTLHAPSIHSLLTLHSLSIHPPFTLYSLSTHSPCTLHSLSTHSPCTLHSLSTHPPLTLHAPSIHLNKSTQSSNHQSIHSRVPHSIQSSPTTKFCKHRRYSEANSSHFSPKNKSKSCCALNNTKTEEDCGLDHISHRIQQQRWQRPL